MSRRGHAIAEMIEARRAPAARTSKTSRVRRFTTADPSGRGTIKTAFYAERGLIHIIDEHTGNYTPCSRAEFWARIIALKGEIDREKYADEGDRKLNLIVDMIKVVKLAKGQGDPFDPDALIQMMRARSRAHILVPGGGPSPGETPARTLILPR